MRELSIGYGFGENDMWCVISHFKMAVKRDLVSIELAYTCHPPAYHMFSILLYTCLASHSPSLLVVIPHPTPPKSFPLSTNAL